MELLPPVLYGIATALPLVVGAVAGARWEPPRSLVGAALAFASGSLITGLAFELFEPAIRSLGLWVTAVGLFAGTGVYVGIKYALANREETGGVALLAAVVLDGTAENLTLGVTLVGNPAGGPLAILAGVAANNLPEAIGGARDMVEDGRSSPRTIGLWTATAAGLVLVVLAGYVLFAGVGTTVLSFVQATAGGAVLASVSIEIMPDAYESGGPAVAFATVAGFLVTFTLV